MQNAFKMFNFLRSIFLFGDNSVKTAENCFNYWLFVTQMMVAIKIEILICEYVPGVCGKFI